MSSWFGGLFSKATPVTAKPANEQAAINAAKAWDPYANNEKAALKAATGFNNTVSQNTAGKMKVLANKAAANKGFQTQLSEAQATQGGGRRTAKGKGRTVKGRKAKSKGKKRSTRK